MNFQIKAFSKRYLEKNKMWVDTNLLKHHHFYDEEEDSLIDVDEKYTEFVKFPNILKVKALIC